MTKPKLSFFDKVRAFFVGSGKIHFQCETPDGRSVAVKYSYTGNIETVAMQDIKRHVSNRFFVETGVRLKSIRYDGHYQI